MDILRNALMPPWASINGRLQARRGASFLAVLLAIVMIGAGASAAWWKFGMNKKGRGDLPLTRPVVLEHFVNEVVERGEIESSSNVEVRCEVQAPNSSGTAIIEIVPEGTLVEAGAFLAKLDDAALLNDRTSQQIVVNASKALEIQSNSTLETAKIALREYEEGTFKQEEEQFQSELFVAEENLRRAEEYVRYSERLAARGYVTAIQLEADRFAVEKAEKELEVARTKLKVLREYTRSKMMKQLQADIATAEANLRSAQETHRLDTEKLAFIEQQIAKCVLRAPSAGQVLYANETGRRSSEIVIEPGTIVRERQAVIRLPDPNKMQVKALVNESRVDSVRPGMPVKIRVDALPGTVAKGRVTRVNEYPQPMSWYGSSVKEYAAFIEIEESVPGLKPGMTSQVAILVEELPNVLQVPVQAVVERGGKNYCLVASNDGPQAREVVIGSTNDKFVVVKDGVRKDELVLLNPRTYDSSGLLPAVSEDRPRGKPNGAAGGGEIAGQGMRGPGSGGLGSGGPGMRGPGSGGRPGGAATGNAQGAGGVANAMDAAGTPKPFNGSATGEGARPADARIVEDGLKKPAAATTAKAPSGVGA